MTEHRLRQRRLELEVEHLVVDGASIEERASAVDLHRWQKAHVGEAAQHSRAETVDLVEVDLLAKGTLGGPLVERLNLRVA